MADAITLQRLEGEIRTLRESEQQHRLLFQANPNPMWLYDPESLRFLDVNEVALSRYGYSREEFLAMTLRDIRPEDALEELDNAIRDTALTGSNTHAVRHRSSDGQIIHAIVTGSTIPFHGRAARLVTVVDITERRNLEEKLLRSQRLEAVGQLTSGIAHDFNNLLMVIQGNAELMEAALADNAPLREDSREIVQAARRAESLIRHLLAFSRKQVMELRVLDLNALIGEVESVFTRILRADIEVVTVLDPSIPAVEADPGQIHQVLMNLVVNARDAMPHGGTLTIESAPTELTATEAAGFPYTVQPGGYVRLSVSDTGVGMTSEVQRQLFEPFFTTKQPGAGTGLGLSTVYGIVKQSGGYIWVRSALGEGTTFDVYLPAVRGRPDAEVRTTSTVEPRTRRDVVLVVEDDRSLRTLFRKVLERAGHTVLEAANGLEALRIVEQFDQRLHIVITDVVMPVMGGQELAERLVARNPELEVVFISGYGEAEAGCRASLGDRCHFVHKPIGAEELLARLHEID
ncbi:MAG TPA: ATP-binding protein [Longimicrobiaceae bacterium]|nr:ATP-binding protein [Longimicrobiaceae bacterium]